MCADHRHDHRGCLGGVNPRWAAVDVDRGDTADSRSLLSRAFLLVVEMMGLDSTTPCLQSQFERDRNVRK